MQEICIFFCYEKRHTYLEYIAKDKVPSFRAIAGLLLRALLVETWTLGIEAI